MTQTFMILDQAIKCKQRPCWDGCTEGEGQDSRRGARGRQGAPWGLSVQVCESLREAGLITQSLSSLEAATRGFWAARRALSMPT